MRIETSVIGPARLIREHWSEWFILRLPAAQPRPRGYGFAWPDTVRAEAVYLPWGVNLIAGFLRRLSLAVGLGLRPTYLDKWLLAQSGASRREGYDQAIQDVQRTLEQRFGEHIKKQFEAMQASGDPIDAEDLGDAAAGATLHDQFTQEERVFFNAAIELATRKGLAIFFSCQDVRCAEQPILARVAGEGGFWLTCFHKRWWVPDPPDGKQKELSRRSLARLGVH